MSTRRSQTPTGTSTILDCLLADGVPILTWINNLITNLQTQLDLLETDITTLKSQIAALQAALAALQACCASVQQYIANNHVALTLTKNQDVANRTTLDVANQVLNIPPPIIAQLLSSAVTAPLGQAVPDGAVLTALGNVFPDFETVPGMTSTGTITIPKTGRYRVVGSWSSNTDEADPIEGYSIGLTIAANGVTNGVTGFGRYTAPIINGRAEEVMGVIPAWALVVGDKLSLLAFTDYPGGVTAYGAYLCVEYIEGT